ncbi:hypothetical protein MUP65_02545 [Patescibacteria group bacterium]|nr:hypothetical protein [Patescibacteria group bacterium]
MKEESRMGLALWLAGVWLAGLFQFLLIPLNLVVFWVVAIVDRQPPKGVFWLAFVAGLISDLFLGVAWGVSSLFFLFLAATLVVIRRHYSTSAWLMAGLISFFELIYIWTIFHRWSLGQSVLAGLVVYLWFVFSPLVQSNSRDLRLKVD